MNIDRHNYEEYFILYMDNELKPAERSMVEFFVRLHPDLKEELDLLMQFKLEPDESVVFETKDDLLKKVRVPAVNESNYNEWLLLYVDNELTGPEKVLVEQFLANHPAAQKQYELLEKTILAPETLIFKDKSSLYRTEKLKRMPVRWRWAAAAAVLLLAIGLTTGVIINRKSGGGEIVKTTAGENRENRPAQKEDAVANNNSVTEEKTEPQEIRINNNNSLTQNSKPNTPVEKKNPELFIPENKKEEIAVAVVKEDLPSNNLPKPLQNSFTQSRVTNKDVAVNPASVIKLKEDLTISPVTNQSSDPSIIYAYNPETDDAELDQTDGKKNKMRGFFRKVARTFEKRTNLASKDDDNKLLVAGLAFKLK